MAIWIINDISRICAKTNQKVSDWGVFLISLALLFWFFPLVVFGFDLNYGIFLGNLLERLEFLFETHLLLIYVFFISFYFKIRPGDWIKFKSFCQKCKKVLIILGAAAYFPIFLFYILPKWLFGSEAWRSFDNLEYGFNFFLVTIFFSLTLTFVFFYFNMHLAALIASVFNRHFPAAKGQVFGFIFVLLATLPIFFLFIVFNYLIGSEKWRQLVELYLIQIVSFSAFYLYSGFLINHYFLGWKKRVKAFVKKY